MAGWLPSSLPVDPGPAGVRVRLAAAKLHLICAASEPTTLRAAVDGGAGRTIEVGRPPLHALLAFETGTPGLSPFSATFG